MLRSGSATLDITPGKPLFLVGYPNVARTATGTHDPLTATAVCLDDGVNRLVMLSLDLLFIDAAIAREWRVAIARCLETRPELIMISCTHTHSGPVTSYMLAWEHDEHVPEPDPQYMHQLGEALLTVCQQAAARLEPAELAWGFAHVEGVIGNRIDPAGPSDPAAGFLVLRAAATRRLQSITVIYAMHPTVLHEDSTLYSADFPYYLRQTLKQLDSDINIAYHASSCGNLSPRNFVKAQTFAEAERLGNLVGQTLLKAICGISDEQFESAITLNGAEGKVDLPLRRFPSVEEAEKQLVQTRATYDELRTSGAERRLVRTAECNLFGAEELVTLARAQADGRIQTLADKLLPVSVQVLQLGPLTLFSLPGELFVEYGLELKQRAIGEAMVITLANGELQGYIVTPEAEGTGSYEANNSLFTPQAGQQMVRKALELQATLLRPTADKSNQPNLLTIP